MRKCWLLVILSVFILAPCACSRSTNGQASNTEQMTWQERYNLGIRYLSEGNYEEAIISFTAAIEIDSKRAPAYVGRGDAYVLSGETEEKLSAAQADYEKAIELDETNTDAYLGLANVYIRQGNRDMALKILQNALEKADDNQTILDAIEKLDIKGVYGQTEFHLRSDYIDPNDMSSAQKEYIRLAVDAVCSNDKNDLFGLYNSTAPFSGEVYTIWGNYKVRITFGYSDPNLKTDLTLDVEARPENGTGFYANISETTLCQSSCACEEWQWNGNVTQSVYNIVGINTDPELSWEDTGTIKNNLRDGTFTHKYMNRNFTEVYQDGVLLERDGIKTNDFMIYTGTLYTYPESMLNEVIDEIYW